jgi:hypothetical protein
MFRPELTDASNKPARPASAFMKHFLAAKHAKNAYELFSIKIKQFAAFAIFAANCY